MVDNNQFRFVEKKGFSGLNVNKRVCLTLVTMLNQGSDEI